MLLPTSRLSTKQKKTNRKAEKKQKQTQEQNKQKWLVAMLPLWLFKY